MNHKLQAQIELDEKIAPFMRYFEIPYYEMYMVLMWESIQKRAEIQYPEMRGKPIQMAGVIIDWEGNPDMRTKVLVEHLSHMLGWIRLNLRLEYPDPQEAALHFWGMMAKHLDHLEKEFKARFNMTIEEYMERRVK